jgi:hypothetical protein
MFEDMSTESIKQFQMLVDKIALEFVKVLGGVEAMRMLFPLLSNNQEFLQMHQRLHQVYSLNGVSFSAAFKEYSRLAQIELNKREGK